MRSPPLVWKLARLDDMLGAGVGYGPVNYAVVKGSEEFYLGRGVTHPVYLCISRKQASLVVGRSGLVITSLNMNPSRVRRDGINEHVAVDRVVVKECL